VSTIVAPPAWPIPQRTPEQIRAQQLAELRALYPDALAWYGMKSDRWMAAPTGATRIIQASTAAALAAQLADHYRQYIPQTPHPSRPHPARPGGSGAVARPHPATAAATASSSPGRHAHQPAGGRLRRGLVRLGLVAEAA